MKISVSLSEEDVAALDSHALEHDLASRSAAVQRAVDLLERADLEGDYAAAWDEWERSVEQDAWEVTIGDGVAHAPQPRVPG